MSARSRLPCDDSAVGDDDGIGFGFFLKLAGIVVGIGIIAMIVFLLIWRAVYAWGFLGGFLFFALVLIGFGWLSDRRKARQYAD